MAPESAKPASKSSSKSTNRSECPELKSISPKECTAREISACEVI
jgi:hypothetical protein